MIRFACFVLCVLTAIGICAQSGSIQYSYGFETPIKNPPWAVEGGINSAGVIDDPSVAEENKIFRSGLPLPSEGEVWNNSNTRSEIRWQKGANGIPHWFPNGSSYSFQFRIYVPREHVCDPISPELVAQWHQPNGFNLRSPPISIRTQNCRIILLSQFSSVFDGKQKTLKKSLLNSGTEWTKGSWHYFIIDIIFDYEKEGKGAIMVYMNTAHWPNVDDRIIEYKGGVGYSNGIGQNFKLGVYKWRWKFAKDVEAARKHIPPVLERVYYYDDVTIKTGLEFGT